MGIFYTHDAPINIVSEAYYGKTKNLLLIEKELAKVIAVIKEEASTSTINKSKPSSDAINQSDSVKIINTLFKEEFGVRDFFITFYTGGFGSEPNAYTMPQSFNVFHRDWSTSMRSKPDALLINVSIDKYLIINSNLNAGELMGIILHEIGHNFDASIITFLGRIIPSLSFKSVFFMPITVILSLLGISIGHIYARIDNIIESLFEKIPGLLKLYGDITNTVNSLTYTIRTFFNSTILLNPAAWSYKFMSFNLWGYAGEKYSDSFATAYGYGNELSSALAKMDKKMFKFDKSARKIPLIGLAYDLGQVSMRILAFGCDPHPDTATRILAQLRKMEREIQDPSIPKAMKVELAAQIKEQKEILTKFTDEDVCEREGQVFSGMWNRLLIETFDGKLDPRELIEIVSRHEE